mmetsp:Transcript_2970/g.8795  ORF Transcript_2970/g.8795 Transcript_2970/m.8795 type:complete len:255 (+) Transcript_2970:290-1054(+)
MARRALPGLYLSRRSLRTGSLSARCRPIPRRYVQHAVDTRDGAASCPAWIQVPPKRPLCSRVAGVFPLSSHLPRDDDVVNLEDHAHALGGERDGGGVHEQRNDNVLLEDVGNGALAHVDARALLPGGVAVAQLRDDVDRVEASVLRERVRHGLQRLGELLDAIGLHAAELVGPVREVVGSLRLRGAASGGEEALLDEAAQHAERVVDRAVGLVEHHAVGRADENGDCLARVGHPRDAHDLGLGRRLLGHVGGGA